MTPLSKEPMWTNLALLRLSSFGFGMIGFVLAMDIVILPLLVLGVAPEQFKNTYLAVLGFSGLLVAALVQPLVGRYSDRTRSRLGRRVPYLLWGCIFVCFGLVGIGFAPNYLALFGIWLFVQVNFNIGNGPYQALIRDLVPANRIGVASSMKVLSDASGALVLVAVSSALISREAGSGPVDWQWLTLGILAFILVTATGITSLTVRAGETAIAMGQGVAAIVQQPNSGLHPQLSRFVLSRLLIMTAITAFPTFGLFFLEDAVGLKNPAEAVGRMALVVGGAVAISIYPAGWLSDRIGRKPVVMVGALGAAASTIWLLWADDAMDVMVIASFLGASVGTFLSSNWALANELGPTGQEGLHMGIVNLGTTGGAALSKLMGPGIDLLNRISEGTGYSALLITCGLLFVVGALLLMPLREDARGTLSSYPRGMR